MKKQLIKITSNIVFLSIFVWLYVQNAGSVDIVKEISWSLFFMITIIQFLGLVVNDIVIKTVVSSIGTSLSFLSGLYSAFISSFGNYFLPLSGGAALRGYYLKKHHKFSYKKFITVMYGLYAVSFLFTSLVLLTALTVLNINGGAISTGLYIFALVIFIFSFLLFTGQPMPVTLVINKMDHLNLRFVAAIFEKIHRVTNGWAEIVADKNLKLKLICYTLMNISLRTFMYFVMFKGLGINVGIMQVLVFNSLISLSLYVTLTPGSLGIRESILLFFSSTLAIGDEQILAINLVDRFSMISVLLLLFLYFRFVKKIDLFEVKKEGIHNG